MHKNLYESFDLTQRTVFGLLAQTLFGVPYKPEPGVDWMAVYRESEKQAVRLQTFANHHLIDDIPEELRERIQLYMTKVMLRSARVHAEHTLAHEVLTQNGIVYTALKGAASSCYYPDPLTRAMGDVDLFVNEKDVERTLELFRQRGYDVEKYTGDRTQYHLTIRKGRRHLELHYRWPGIPEGPVGDLIRDYLSDLCDNAVLLKGALTTCRCPSDFHHALIMLTHFQRHLMVEGIGLRHLCDWAVFVHHYSKEEFPRIFRDALSAVGLWRFARMLSLTATIYIGLPEQPWMREDQEDVIIARELMRDIVSGGNFGVKDRQRAYEAKFFPQEEGAHPKSGRIVEAIRSVNRSSRKKWPIMKRIPLFLPWGWVCAVVCYLRNNRKRQKEGKKIRLAQAYKDSEIRRSLYQKLRVYERP